MLAPHEKNPDKDAQTAALLALANQADSTHDEVANASAARFIQLLRLAYPDIPTPTETSPDSSEPHRAQRVLFNYLNQVINQLIDTLGTETLESKDISGIILSEVEQKYLDYPGIKSTIELIKYIQGASRYSTQDKILVLTQMQCIAITYPATDKTQWNWNWQHATWSTNPLHTYNPKTTKDEIDYVIASPGETLNLVCRAILDQSRYPKDQQEVGARIDALFNCCLNEQTQIEKGEFETCSTGRQHNLLSLLNQSYLDRANTEVGAKPVEFVHNLSTFLLDNITRFLEAKIQALQSGEKSQLCLDWISHYNGLQEFKPAPAVTFLRQQYPVLNREKKSEHVDDVSDDLDLRWKGELTYFLVKQCRAFHLKKPMKLFYKII
jgi:hypothetical protein